MSSEEFEVPKYGSAGVAFLGVEMADAWIVIVSVFVGLGVGTQVGVVAYVGIPVAGFFANKWYVGWRSKALPGQLKTFLFRIGLVGYSKSFKGGDVVFVGDSDVINPDAGELVEHVERARGVQKKN